MSAKKITYLAIKEKLEALESVETCRLFNNQFQDMNEENAFPFPCVFIEFLELDYLTKSQGLQEADAKIRLHVGFDSLQTEDLEVLDLLDEIHGEIQRFTDLITFSPMNRVFEGQDTDHDAVSVWLMDYNTLITDLSGDRRNKLRLTQITSAEINVDTTTEATKPWLKQN